MHIKANRNPTGEVTIIQFLLKSNDEDVMVVYINGDGLLDAGELSEFSGVERGELIRTLPIQEYNPSV